MRRDEETMTATRTDKAEWVQVIIWIVACLLTAVVMASGAPVREANVQSLRQAVPVSIQIGE